MTAYLDLAPVTAALRDRPEEFRDLSGRLHHLLSRHTFVFEQDGSVRIVADCDCSFPADTARRRQTVATHIQRVARVVLATLRNQPRVRSSFP
jgi:hypothetical protein